MKKLFWLLLGAAALGCLEQAPALPKNEFPKTLPPLTAAGWINSPPLTDADLAGKVVVIDAWFADCPSCAAASPRLVEVWKKYRDRGVQFVGLTFDKAEQMEDIQAFIDRFGIGWPNGYGAEKTLAVLGVRVYPALMVVDRTGAIVWTDNHEGKIDKAIDKALAEK